MSEFGSGIVVPLVKFGEHMQDRHAQALELALDWQEMSPIEREKVIVQGGDQWSNIINILSYQDIDDVISMYVMIWAQGASDHLVDVDLKIAPDSLLTLRKTLLGLRWETHLNFDREDWQNIRQLYKEAAMDIDEKLIGTDSDWGDS